MYWILYFYTTHVPLWHKLSIISLHLDLDPLHGLRHRCPSHGLGPDVLPSAARHLDVGGGELPVVDPSSLGSVAAFGVFVLLGQLAPVHVPERHEHHQDAPGDAQTHRGEDKRVTGRLPEVIGHGLKSSHTGLIDAINPGNVKC